MDLNDLPSHAIFYKTTHDMKIHTNHRVRGFTLIEMLVVIVLIAALAAIAFQATMRVRESAKSAATLSQLRDIGVAVGGWMSDNGGFFPPCWNGDKNQSYAQVLDPYMHGVENLRKADSRFIGVNKRIVVEVRNGSHPITFSLNDALCPNVTLDKGDPAKTRTLIHSSRVSRLSDVILMADGCQNPKNLGQANASAFRVKGAAGASGPNSQRGGLIPVGPDADEPSAGGWFRYPYGKCHALMCDGSARTFPKGSIKKGNVWMDSDIP